MKPRNPDYQLIGIDEWIVSQGYVILGTTLGSCVSVCLWDPKTLTGGLNHFLLPIKAGKRLQKNQLACYSEDVSDYQHEVIEVLIEQVLALGIRPERLHALVVGGGESSFDYYKVGEKNLQIAVTLLKEKGIQQIKVSGGGPYSRKIQFYVGEGKVMVRKYDLTHRSKETEEVIWL
jgi:chemotaxis protein CheD